MENNDAALEANALCIGIKLNASWDVTSSRMHGSLVQRQRKMDFLCRLPLPPDACDAMGTTPRETAGTRQDATAHPLRSECQTFLFSLALIRITSSDRGTQHVNLARAAREDRIQSATKAHTPSSRSRTQCHPSPGLNPKGHDNKDKPRINLISARQSKFLFNCKAIKMYNLWFLVQQDPPCLRVARLRTLPDGPAHYSEVACHAAWGCLAGRWWTFSVVMGRSFCTGRFIFCPRKMCGIQGIRARSSSRVQNWNIKKKDEANFANSQSAHNLTVCTKKGVL